MIFLGDSNIPYETIEKITSIQMIEQTSPNATVLFDFDVQILQHCQKNDVLCAVIVKDITQALYANALMAKYIICEQSIAKTLQNLAENYMFDSKIITIINSSKEIENIALDGIDGVIYKGLL